MRIARYKHAGEKKLGAVSGEDMIDLKASSHDPGFPTSMTELIDLDGPWLEVVRGLLENQSATDLVRIPFSECELLLPISRPSQIIGVGRSYRANSGPPDQPRPPVPYLFMKTAKSLVPSGASLIRPFVSERHDWEGEIAVIIGRTARHVAPFDALSYVAGYSAFNGGSIRDWQLASEQVTAGKNFWHSGGFGPYIVTTDEIADPQNLTLRTRLNGEVVQEDNTSTMVFSIAELISVISEYTLLEPGDVISTGTPLGVGARRNPQRWLDEGDVISVEIEGFATLHNSVEREVEPQGADYDRWRIPPKV